MMRHGLWSLLGFAVLACQDGQSGSENNDPKPPIITPEPQPPGIPPIPHCPCGTTGGTSPIRARIVAAEPFPEVGQTRYRLIAGEPLGDSEQVAPGEEFGGYSDGGLPCGGPQSFAVGDEVVAFYTRGRQDESECCEYIECSTDCEPLATPDDDAAREACREECADETADVCATHADEARLRGTVMLLHWGEQLVVGKSAYAVASIDASDVTALGLPREECEAVLDDLYPLLIESDPSEAPPAPPGPKPLPAPSGSAPEPSIPPSATPTPPATTPPPSATAPAGAPTPTVNPSTPDGPPSVAHPEEVRVRCAAP